MDLPANCDRFVFSMGEKEFLVSSFTAREYLSRPFEIFVGIAHEDDFDADGFFRRAPRPCSSIRMNRRAGSTALSAP